MNPHLATLFAQDPRIFEPLPALHDAITTHLKEITQ